MPPIPGIQATNIHPQYSEYSPDWTILRDCAKGGRAIRDKGTTYLPKLPKQSANDYSAYLKRASFYNAFSRTVDGLTGMAFVKTPALNIPDKYKDWQENITLSGESLVNFAQKSLRELLTVGGFGVLVDYPNLENAPQTLAEEQRLGLRPYLRMYLQEDILNWRTLDNATNSKKLTQVILSEVVQERSKDSEFTTIYFRQVRVLDIDGEGYYRVRVFRPNNLKNVTRDLPAVRVNGKQVQLPPQTDFNLDKWEQHGETIYPMKGGANMTEIPFIFAGTEGCEPGFDKPPMIDLAEVNLSHYRTSADLEHGAFYTAMPTPYITGVSAANAPKELGPRTIWAIESPEATAGYVEFTGQGLGFLQQMMQVKESHMAFLGSRMLTPDKRETETAESAQIHRAGENSVLAFLARNMGEAITKGLQMMVAWQEGRELNESDAAILFICNLDFIPAAMTGGLLREMIAAVQANLMTQDDFIAALQRHDIIAHDRTIDEIMADLREAGLVKPPENNPK